MKIRDDVKYADVQGRLKARGIRQPSEETIALRKKIGEIEAGKQNGFLLELEKGETLQQIRPRIAAAGKILNMPIRTETRDDDQAIWIWKEAGERQPRRRRAK